MGYVGHGYTASEKERKGPPTLCYLKNVDGPQCPSSRDFLKGWTNEK